MNEQLLETRVTLLEEPLREMGRTWIIKYHFQEGDLVPIQTFEWYPPALTDLSPEMLMEVLNPKPVQENGKGNNCD